METQIIKINNLLKQLSYISNTTDFNKQELYSKLITYSIPFEERIKEIDFNNIIKEFNTNPNINIFIEQNNPYLCNLHSNNKNSNNKINISISLKENHLEENIKKIFNFIIEKNITHTSYLTKKIQIDNLIIKLDNTKDTSTLISFIKKSIKPEDMYEPNPFLIHDDKISLIIDKESYSNAILDYLFNYITNTKEVSYESLKKYIQDELNNIKNNKEITTLILKSLEFQKKDYIYEYFNKKNNFETEIKLLKEIIVEMIKKYGITSTKKSLLNYQKTHKLEYITRNNNLRNKVTSSKKFNNYIDQLNEEELTNIINEIVKITKNSHDLTLDKKFLLENIALETYRKALEINKNGYNQVSISLINLSQGNYDYITRNNNMRRQAKKYLKKEEIPLLIRETLEEKGYIIEDDIDLYYLYANHIAEENKRRDQI